MMNVIERELRRADNSLASGNDAADVCEALAKLYWTNRPFLAKAYGLRANRMGKKMDLSILDGVIAGMKPSEDFEGAYLLGRAIGTANFGQAIVFLQAVADSIHQLAGQAALALADLLAFSKPDESFRKMAYHYYAKAAELGCGDLLPPKQPQYEHASRLWGT